MTRAILIGLAAIGLMWAARGRSGCSNPPGECRLHPGWWDGAPDDGETILSMELGENGRGELVYGFNRVIHHEIPFRFETRGDDELKIEFGGRWKGKKQLRYQLQRGRYSFRWRDLDDGTWHEVTYRCRLTFSESPFPDGADTGAVVYYGP